MIDIAGLQTRVVGAFGADLPRRLRRLQSALTMANVVGLLGAALALFLLLFLHEPWNIRLPLYLILAVWIILRPRVALYLLPLSVPWGALDYISPGSLRFNSTDILVILLGISWLLSYTLRTGSAAHGPRDYEPGGVPLPLLLALLALLGAMVISTTVAISLKSSLKEIFKWLEFLIVVVAGSGYLRTRRQIWTILIMSLLAALSQAFLGYYQEIFSVGPVSFIRAESLRVYGTFNQPNPYAGYINLSLSVVLALALVGGRRQTRILSGIAAFLLAIAEFFSESRGGWLACITAALLIVLVGLPQLRPFWRLLFIGIWAFIEGVLIGLIPQRLFTPLLNFLGLTSLSFTQPDAQSYATAERLAHWLAGIHMFFDHPLLGVGIGNYGDAYPHYAIGIFVLPLGHAHNYFINVAAEMGILGLLIYTLWLIVIAVLGSGIYRRLRSKERLLRRQTQQEIAATTSGNAGGGWPRVSRRLTRAWLDRLADDRALALGILAAFLSVLMHNMFDDLYVQGMTDLMALLLIVLIRLEPVERATLATVATDQGGA
jgi:O-antigen ligase